jgi:hypothetical protein
MVGHYRRYEPKRLVERLARHGFTIERSGGYGMQLKSSRLNNLGLALMARYPRRALWCYNRLMMPMALAFQKRLRLTDGFECAGSLDEVLLVCRKMAAAAVTCPSAAADREALRPQC